MGESNPREVGSLAMMQAYVNEVVNLGKREERCQRHLSYQDPYCLDKAVNEHSLHQSEQENRL